MRKGKRAEQFIRDQLLEQLGIKASYTRTEQATLGGWDLTVHSVDNPQGCLGLDRYAIEVKHQRIAYPDQWWQEAISNITTLYPAPLLFWKQTFKYWTVRLGLNVFMPIQSYKSHYLDVSLETFFFMVREGQLMAIKGFYK